MMVFLTAEESVSGLTAGETIGLIALLFALVVGIMAVIAAVAMPIFTSRNGVKKELKRIELNNQLHEISLRRIYESVGLLHSQIHTLWTVGLSQVDQNGLNAAWPKLAEARKQYEDELQLILTEVAALVQSADGRDSALQTLADGIGDAGSFDVFDYLASTLDGDEKQAVIQYRARLRDRWRVINRVP